MSSYANFFRTPNARDKKRRKSRFIKLGIAASGAGLTALTALVAGRVKKKMNLMSEVSSALSKGKKVASVPELTAKQKTLLRKELLSNPPETDSDLVDLLRNRKEALAQRHSDKKAYNLHLLNAKNKSLPLRERRDAAAQAREIYNRHSSPIYYTNIVSERTKGRRLHQETDNTYLIKRKLKSRYNAFGAFYHLADFSTI